MKDFYSLTKTPDLNINNDKSSIIQHPARILIVGASGTGKTNCLLNILDDMNCFTKYYIYAKMLGSDPLYDNVLIPKIQDVEKKNKLNILEAIDNNLENLPLVEELDHKQDKVFIFDDLINNNKIDLKKISDYFIASRKKRCSLIFISQDYIKIPQTIRMNVSSVVITSIKSNNALNSCIRDICEGEYNKVKDLYTKRKDVFIKTIDSKSKPIYILDF